MRKVYKPKKDLIYAIAVWGISILGLIIFLSELNNKSLFAFLITMVLSFLLWFNIGYKIEGDKLIIRHFIFREKIPVKEIKSIKKVRNLFSSYSLSVNKIQLKYKRHSVSYISIADSEEFINDIEALRKNI